MLSCRHDLAASRSEISRRASSSACWRYHSAGLLLLPPIPQDQSYHQFADQRTIFGIPNFWNVVSNFPFLAVGAAGLRRFRHDPATVVFFLGVFLTGIGSSYYHWDPNDGTLFWDRCR